jgi:hypothetical protein
MGEYLEGLFRGSPNHKATQRGPNTALIKPINDDDDSIQDFQSVIREAIARADEEDFEIKPHKSSSDPLGRYDSAAITAVGRRLAVSRINDLPRRNSNANPPAQDIVESSPSAEVSERTHYFLRLHLVSR